MGPKTEDVPPVSLWYVMWPVCSHKWNVPYIHFIWYLQFIFIQNAYVVHAFTHCYFQPLFEGSGHLAVLYVPFYNFIITGRVPQVFKVISNWALFKELLSCNEDISRIIWNKSKAMPTWVLSNNHTLGPAWNQNATYKGSPTSKTYKSLL